MATENHNHSTKKLNASEQKKQLLKRQKAQSVPREFKSNLELSSNPKFPSNFEELDHPLALSPTSNQHDLAQGNKKALFL
ncbi:hypothetical protein [Variovorax guangxiensis]|uniref:hypothetical protein n=1 Tax=Variovorax guangxiensis TaxID=1775474 RepID=UPI0028623A94|nr:hypothetical protein [Variovorax guangxiensis]MDR6855561.1 hypothetical protein [Variovorax guangxiensis]